MIRYFGADKIWKIHFRNVSAPLPHFVETFMDNGYYDMYKIMKALHDVDYDGIVILDHSPASPGALCATRLRLRLHEGTQEPSGRRGLVRARSIQICALQQHFERNHFERLFVSSFETRRADYAGFVGFLPKLDAHAPLVASFESREAEFRPGSDQVIADWKPGAGETRHSAARRSYAFLYRPDPCCIFHRDKIRSADWYSKFAARFPERS